MISLNQFKIQCYSLARVILGKRISNEIHFKFNAHLLLNNNVLFIHIPKAAGTSIATHLYGKRIGHFTVVEYRTFLGEAKFNEKFKFSVVRNPYDRLFSAYNYARQGGSKDGAIRNPSQYQKKEFNTFESFVMNWLVYQDVNTIDLIFRPQYLFLYEGTKLQVDYVGNVENINSLKGVLEKETNAPFIIQKLNSSKRLSKLSKIYSPELARVVSGIYQKDFDLFSYNRTIT